VWTKQTPKPQPLHLEILAMPNSSFLVPVNAYAYFKAGHRKDLYYVITRHFDHEALEKENCIELKLLKESEVSPS